MKGMTDMMAYVSREPGCWGFRDGIRHLNYLVEAVSKAMSGAAFAELDGGGMRECGWALWRNSL